MTICRQEETTGGDVDDDLDDAYLWGEDDGSDDVDDEGVLCFDDVGDDLDDTSLGDENNVYITMMRVMHVCDVVRSDCERMMPS